MSYPTEERLKLLIETVSKMERARRTPNNYEDVVFHGVVKEIVALEAEGAEEESCDHNYLEVCPFDPRTVEDTGHLTFEDGATHPLKDIDEDTRREQVFVIDVPPKLIGLYYRPGDNITYWRYSGVGENAEKVRGSYVTKVGVDKSFWAKVEHVCCPPESEDDEDCETAGPPAESPFAFNYKFTAFVPDPAATERKDKFKEFTCGEEGEPFTGIAFNLSEILNGMGTSGTGVSIDSSGRRNDDGKYILPVGPTVVKVTPIIDDNTGRCDFKEYYFGPIPNEFGDAPKECKRIVYRWRAKWLCATGEWDSEYGNGTENHGTDEIQYLGQNCTTRDFSEPVGEWFRFSHNADDGYSLYDWIQLGECCDSEEDTGDDPDEHDVPELPEEDPEDACTKYCIHQLTVTHDCAAEEGEEWGEITEEGGSSECRVPDGTEGKWVEGAKEGTVVTFDAWIVGAECTSVGECDPLSSELYPELPLTPTSACGFTGTKTVVVGWNAETCEVTTEEWTFKDGVLVGVE